MRMTVKKANGRLWRVIDRGTGKEIPYAFACDTDRGWVKVFVYDGEFHLNKRGGLRTQTLRPKHGIRLERVVDSS